MDRYGAFTIIWNRDRSSFRSTPYQNDGEASTSGWSDSTCLLRTVPRPTPSRSYATLTLPPTADATSSHCLRVVVSIRPFCPSYIPAICLAFAYTAA